MKNIIIFLTCILIVSTQNLYAQTDSGFWNSEMIKIATPTSKPGWINIRPEININPSVFFTAKKKALQLGVNDDMQLSKIEIDKTGFTHYKYQQFYKGYKVIFSEFLLHALNNKLVTANGKIITGLNRTPAVNISVTTALQRALQFLPAAQYAWQIPQLENNYKQILHNPNATYKPAAELVWISIYEKSDNKNSPQYELAYMFDIYPASLYGKKIFISAADGRIQPGCCAHCAGDQKESRAAFLGRWTEAFPEIAVDGCEVQSVIEG